MRSQYEHRENLVGGGERVGNRGELVLRLLLLRRELLLRDPHSSPAAKPGGMWPITFSTAFPGRRSRRLPTPGAVKSVKFRPSRYQRLMAYGDQLADGEGAKAAKAILTGARSKRLRIPPRCERQYFYFLDNKTPGFCRRRGRNFPNPGGPGPSGGGGIAPEWPEIRPNLAPDWGHLQPPRFGFWPQARLGDKYGNFEEFGIKFAYHDLLNHDVGFIFIPRSAFRISRSVIFPMRAASTFTPESRYCRSTRSRFPGAG